MVDTPGLGPGAQKVCGFESLPAHFVIAIHAGGCSE